MSIVVQNKRPRKTNATGSRSIRTRFTASVPTRLTSVMMHFNEAPTTSENLVVTLAPIAGAAYNTVLYSVDPSEENLTDICWRVDGDMWLEEGDRVNVTYANTDRKTYGLQITAEEYV